MSVLSLTTGSVQTRGNGKIVVSAWYRRTPTSREFTLQQSEQDRTCEVKVLQGVEVMPASSINRGQATTWVTRRVDYPNNSLLRFILQDTKISPGGAPRMTQRQFVLRPRDNAALRQIAIDLPQDAYTLLPVLYITGRYDLLTIAEVKAANLHINISGSNDLETYNPENFDSGFAVEVLEKEITTPPAAKPVVVVNPTSGKKKVVMNLRRVRRINTGLSDQ